MPQITIVNSTDDEIRVAIFRKPVSVPSIGNFAWAVVAPPPGGGETLVEVPEDYQVYVNLPALEERQDPYAGAATAPISIPAFSGRFVVVPEEGGTVSLARAKGDPTPEELRIDNQAGSGVWTHVQQDGRDVYAPQVLSPGATFLASRPAPALFLAILSGSASEGSQLAEEEISTEAIRMEVGQTATVSGSLWEGFAISVG